MARTGQGFLAKVGNWLSYVPFGGLIGGWLVGADALIESAGWLLRGKVMSAVTALGAGSAAAISNFQTGSNIYWYGVNAASGLFTSASINDHARGLTEGVIGTVTKPLGLEPTVLSSYPAGIGSINGAPSGPGYWATRAAQERGQDPNAAYSRYVSGDGGVHVNELGSAYGRSA